MKRLLNILVLSLVCSFGFGQGFNRKAQTAYSVGEYVVASQYSDSAIVSTEKDNSFTWLLRGYIYKSIWANVDTMSPSSNARETAIASFRQLRTMENADSADLAKGNKAMYTLAKSYYNDAVVYVNNNLLEKAEGSFEKYLNLSLEMYPDKDLSRQKIEFYNALGSRAIGIYNKYKPEKSEYYDMALSYYYKSFNIDSLDRSANYNIGIIYYNRGVDLILSMPDETDLEKIFEIQDKTVELFLLSKPFIKRAHNLDPTNKQIMEAGKGIDWQIGDEEGVKEWDEKLEQTE
jgi:hypothetical protein